MKKLIQISLFFGALSFANASDPLSKLPVGDFDFMDVTHNMSKHTVQVDVRSPTHKKRYQVLKDKGYRCARLGSSLYRCSQFLKNVRYNPWLNLSKFKSLEPSFDFENSVEVITVSEWVSKYRVKQRVSSKLGDTEEYVVYYHNDGKLMADIKFSGKVYRYSVISGQTLSMVYKDIEILSRFEFFEHYLDLMFMK